MSSVIGTLQIMIGASMAKLASGLAAAGKSVSAFSMQMNSAINFAEAGFGGLTAAVLGVGGPIAALTAFNFGMKLAAETEMAQAAFETMTGSAEKALEIVTMIKDMAARTPFESPELITSGKELMAMGVEQKDLKATLTALGDIAAITGYRLQDLSEAFGKVAARGEVSGRTLEQFARHGINLREAMGKVLGKTPLQVEKLVSAGQVGFDTFKRSIEGLVSEGGRFHSGMERASKTVMGLASTIKDNIGLTLEAVAKGFTDAFDLREVMQNVVDFTEFLRQNAYEITKWFIGHSVFYQNLKNAILAAGDVFRGLAYDFKNELGQAFGWLGKLAAGWAGLTDSFILSRQTFREVARSIALAFFYALDSIATGVASLAKSVAPLLGIMADLETAASRSYLARSATALTKDDATYLAKQAADAAALANNLRAGSKSLEDFGKTFGQSQYEAIAKKINESFDRMGQKVTRGKAELIDLGADGSDALRALFNQVKEIAGVEVKGLSPIDNFKVQLEELRLAAKKIGLPVLDKMSGDLIGNKFPTAEQMARQLEESILDPKMLQRIADMKIDSPFLVKRFEEKIYEQLGQSKTLEAIRVLRKMGGAIEDLGAAADKNLTKMKFDVFAKALTPLDHFRSGLAAIDKLMTDQMLTVEQYNAGLAGLAADFMKDGTAELKLPPALLAGSAEAISAINKFQASNAPRDTQARVEAILAQQKAIQEENLRVAKEMKAYLEKLATPKVIQAP